MNLKNDACDDKYFSPFAIKAEAEKIHNLAFELEMDKETKEWRQYTILCNFLIKQLKHRSHQHAIKDLKLVFGGNRGLTEENEKFAKKSSNANMAVTVAPRWGHQPHMPTPMMMGHPMRQSQQFFSYDQPTMAQPNFQGNFQGDVTTVGSLATSLKIVFQTEVLDPFIQKDTEEVEVGDLLEEDSTIEVKENKEETDLNFTLRIPH